MTEDDLKNIISSGESNIVDFKQIWPNNACLLHDILCLANAINFEKQDRMLIFGVSDKKEFHDVTNDPNRKSSAQVYDLLNKIINRRPDLKIENIKTCTGQAIDVLVIKDKPEKPYYLTKDYSSKNKKLDNKNTLIRAGVIYSRTNDRNTPTSDEGIDDLHLQKMFEERFGINYSIKDRFLIYLKDYYCWTLFYSDELTGFYYEKYPEFTILDKKSMSRTVKSAESWMPASLHATPTISIYQLKYHNTLIMELEVFDSGDSNYELCLPEVEVDNFSGELEYYFDKDSIKYYLSCLFHEHGLRKNHDFRKLRNIQIKE